MTASHPDLTKPISLAWFTMGSPTIVEVAMRGTADVAVMDLQHGLWDRMSAHTAVHAASPRPAFMRVAANSEIEISRGLDTGAAGVIVPMVDTAAEAAEAVRHAHFPPLGHRSAGGVRPQFQGAAYAGAGSSRSGPILGVMIETAEGVRNVDAIVATAGVDFIFIGPFDLGLSLGGNAQALEESAKEVLKACRKHGKPCGIYTANRAAFEQRRAEGFSITVLAGDVSAVMSAFAASA